MVKRRYLEARIKMSNINLYSLIKLLGNSNRFLFNACALAILSWKSPPKAIYEYINPMPLAAKDFTILIQRAKCKILGLRENYKRCIRELHKVRIPKFTYLPKF